MFEDNASALEWAAWAQLLFSLFSQVSYLQVPSYNFPLAFWGCYCTYSKNGRAVFTNIVFLGLSILTDIIWSLQWGVGDANLFSCPQHGCHTTQFAVAMLVFNMFAKFAATFFAYQLFVDLGGAWSMRNINSEPGVQSNSDYLHHKGDGTDGMVASASLNAPYQASSVYQDDGRSNGTELVDREKASFRDI